MLNSTKMVRTLFAAAGLLAVAASSSAFGISQQIQIDRALDSPTLTVRYTGVAGALVELRVNGESIGTRTVSATKDSGETNFTLSVADLKDGDNDVEIRIFDRTGKLVAHDHTSIATNRTQHGPVFLSGPKMGATVSESVEMKVGFDKSIVNPYVSFFIDGNFKSMTNTPPYTYVWDSQRESNGWHELEAWAIDDSSETHKSGKIRVFVNNVQGNTNRPGTVNTTELLPEENPTDLAVTATASHLRDVHVKSAAKASTSNHKLGKTPSISPLPSGDTVLSSPAGVKAFAPAEALSTSYRAMLPTGTRNAGKADGSVVSIRPAGSHLVASGQHVGTNIQNVVSAASLMEITRGSVLPNIGTFEIALDSNFVDFHGVLPRVDDGVPMSPLRFLFEKKGGVVDWENTTKTVTAKVNSSDIKLHVGDPYALLNHASISLERPSYIDRGRTVVPLSFISSALKVKVQYDKDTNHMLITSNEK